MEKYKLMKINDYDGTRDVILQNLDTGTRDVCFDDSELTDHSHSSSFAFMKEGRTYDCKILLFGEPTPESSRKGTRCQVISDNIACGDAKLVKVSIGRDIYFVLRWQVENYLDKDYFYFRYSRKDLIQVDDTIHGDCFA